MKTKLLIAGLAAFASIALFLLFGRHRDIEHSDSRSSQAGERSPVISENATPVAAKPVAAVTSDSSIRTGSAEEWLRAHDAGIVIQQNGELNRGAIRIGSIQGDLGETPPRYHHQLKAGKFQILLGEEDDRHLFQRYISTVREEQGALIHTIVVSISWTKWAPRISLGGFIFHKDEDNIEQIGILLPEIEVPPGDDASRPRWATTIRIGNHEISAEDLAKAMPQPLGPDIVLVMPTHPGPPPATARVLWLALDANGSFVVARK